MYCTYTTGSGVGPEACGGSGGSSWQFSCHDSPCRPYSRLRWPQQDSRKPATMHGTPRNLEDVNDAEEAALRHAESGSRPAQRERPERPTPATSAAPMPGERGGSPAGGEGTDGAAADPLPGFPHGDIHGAETATTAATGDDDDEMEPPPPPPPVAPQPCSYPPGRADQLGIQADNIKQQVASRKGIGTYRTTWKDYDKYHLLLYKTPAPHCPYTDLLWLTASQGVAYVSWMAKEKRTSSQVSPSCSVYLATSLSPLLRCCYPLIPYLLLPFYLLFLSLLSSLLCGICPAPIC